MRFRRDQLTYAGGAGGVQAVALVAVAGVAFHQVVADALAADTRAHHALVHLWTTKQWSFNSINAWFKDPLI